MTLPKIDEWIKEAEQRPASAQTILKLIAGRLRDLSERNEELLKENIALQDGSRVEQYRKRIVLLEYQLDLLRRRFGLSGEELASLAVEPAAAPLSLLVCNAHGRILRIEPGLGTGSIGRMRGELCVEGEAPRLLAVPSTEELLLLFTSGRVGTCPVEDIPIQPGGFACACGTGAGVPPERNPAGTKPAGQSRDDWDLEQATLPDEPHAGERLACLTLLSGLALADYFLQASRRGCVKKTMTSMAENILENRYLGRGAIQRLDQPLDLALCGKKEFFVLVTHEGRLLGLDVDALPYSVEERIKLDATDHVVAGFIIRPGEMLFCLTQTGKVISRSASFIEPVRSSLSRGQALIPPARLEQGVDSSGLSKGQEEAVQKSVLPLIRRRVSRLLKTQG